MNSTQKRLVVLVVALAVVAGVIALVVIAGVLALSTGTLISREEPTATPTKTPKPTYTVTSTPTNTSIPTDTPTPTATWTPTPEATNTPVVYTATPTEPPTDTPVPTAAPTNTRRPRPTNTPRPRRTNTPRPPTATPRPQFAWNGSVTNQLQNCGLTRVFGFTLDRAGNLAGDIWVHYWADGWEGAWAKSQWTDFGAGTSWQGDEGNWDGTIYSAARDGVWHVCITSGENSWECISNTVDAQTSADCNSGIQIYHITFRQN